MTVVLMHLDQFDNPEENDWVKTLISLSSDFFKRVKERKGWLFLESDSNWNDSLERLSKASSIDFNYNVIFDTSIEKLSEELDEYYDNGFIEHFNQYYSHE